LVTLLIVMSTMATIIHSLLVDLRQTRQAAMELQAHWLADSAVGRAIVQLRADPTYEGETWKPWVGMKEDNESVGAAEIRIERTSDNRDLRVVVDLSGPAEPRTFTVGPQQSYGHRLVMDLTPTTRTAATPPPLSVIKAAADAHGRDIIVAIDAGHGGVDPGSIGKRGTYEKHVTLAIARRLKERIDREPGMRAILTRDNDTFVEHRERIARARRQQADMFVSIHADSYTNRSVAGSSVYVLSARGASDESARWLADRENAADLIGGVKLDDKDSVLASVLLDLSQSASMSASVDAAEKVMHELYKIGNITNRGVKNAGFLVLKSPDIPSMLVETAYISNPAEEQKLRTQAHQQAIAEAIFGGVREYFRSSPPDGSLFARQRETRRGVTPIMAGAAP
jgi:N-acetylmuramoyl-L-alanine amidase